MTAGTSHPYALWTSGDCGRTWTPASPTNLNHNTSKPCAGTLSTCEHYLLGATAADCVSKRDIQSIALGGPGDVTFSRVYAVRPGFVADGPGISNPKVLSGLMHEQM